MNKTSQTVTRRDFSRITIGLGATVAAGLPRFAQAAPKIETKLELGIDNFAVRAMGWKAKQLIRYAAKLKVNSLFITDLYAFENFNNGYLADLRKLAADRHLKLYVGTWSICPTSQRFNNHWGTAEGHLALGVRTAKALGSPVIRVILGGGQDRLTPGGIDARIDDTVKVLKASRSRCVDAAVKIAVENHAGDMHSLELVRLIEDAGKDFVGANLDSGNAVWALEDPLDNLENLGAYTLTSSLRDTVVWPSPNGVTAQWTAMGEGMVDWKKYFARFAKLCPEAPVNIETISGFNRELAFKKEGFWKAWPHGKPKGFENFLAWAQTGKPHAARKRPDGVDPMIADGQYQRGDLQRSISYCKKIGLGR